MNTIRGPEVKGTVEFKENQMRNEDCWNCSQVGTDEEISDAKGYDTVKIYAEKNAGDDDEKVVADQLPGNSRMESWWSWRVGIELVEGLDEELRWREEEVDGDETEDSAWWYGTFFWRY